MKKITEEKTSTITFTTTDVFDLFQKVYEQASTEVISVYIDVRELKATIVYRAED